MSNANDGNETTSTTYVANDPTFKRCIRILMVVWAVQIAVAISVRFLGW